MGHIIAKVAVAKAIYSIDQPFDYLIPEELTPSLQVGMRVLVPFGQGNRGSDGLVLSISQTTSYDKALKSILVQLDETPVLNEEAIKLAIWMREFCYCTVFDAIRAMLPAGLFFALKDIISLKIPPEEAIAKSSSSKSALTLVNLLLTWEGKGEIKEIRLAFGSKDPNPAIRFLIKEDIAEMDYGAKRNVSDKTDTIVALTVPPEDALAQVTPKRKTSPLRYDVIELLSQIGMATSKEICYYTNAKSATIKSLEKSGLVELFTRESLRSPHKEHIPPTPEPTLNPEQSAVLEGLLDLLGNPAASLLYGVTGSGKTQVYIALIHHLLKIDKTALVLVPEIALTPQFLRIFTAQFGNNIAILHSALPMGERYDEWKRVKRGDVKVVLGTRSAVFAPLENIGVIILDEEQELSYKSDATPRYHARDIAKFRCVRHNALLLLGSATPSVDSMYRAKEGIYHLFTLNHRFNQNALPQVTIIDMKQELSRGNDSSISRHLRNEIAQNFAKKEQAILFLNRRGANSMVSCLDCGNVPECPRCSVRLTYHKANNRLICHYCNYHEVYTDRCKSCGGNHFFLGTGTQQVQEDLETTFPSEKILRMDTDTVSVAHPHDELLSQFQTENVPVLIGTQMVAKGLDFENVTLVGVISGDLSLYAEDLWAGERTFSLITQVVGRAGRGEKKGRAIIQTHTPEHDIITAAAKQDYDSFYHSEITARKLRNYPPFREMLIISASSPQQSHVMRAMDKMRITLHQGIQEIGDDILILGPAPAPVAKINNRYYFRITVIGNHNQELRNLLSFLLTSAKQDKDNKMVTIYIDRLTH